MNHEPWNAIRAIAKRTAAAYDPGEDGLDPGRCDLQMVQDALQAARMALAGTRDTPDDGPACIAVGELLHALHRIVTGVSGDARDLATAARDAADGALGADELPDALGELAGDINALRGPKP